MEGDLTRSSGPRTRVAGCVGGGVAGKSPSYWNQAVTAFSLSALCVQSDPQGTHTGGGRDPKTSRWREGVSK
jgi:hypothetical protein